MKEKYFNVLCSSFIYSIKSEYVPFAIKIMNRLYSNFEVGLSKESIYEIFENIHNNAVDITLYQLEKLLLIKSSRVINQNISSTFYTLTNYGKIKFSQFYILEK
ncbi:MAG: hypothetical protein VB130_04350 [Clostridium sp.]|nr:hypothetical protein [Clostridium sp.]